MYDNTNKNKGGFPNPLESPEVKASKEYGKKYAKAIEEQWGKLTDTFSPVAKRNKDFSKNRAYATGVQDTSIYKQLLRSLNPNEADGSLMNMDYTPVPILPKFVRVVVNKILSRNPYPNLEAIDPLSSSEKNEKKKKTRLQVEARDELVQLKEQTGVVLDMDPEEIPETLEEAEIFMDTNIKTDGEIAAQIGTDLTLTWNNFNDSTMRRLVNDIATLGMCVTKRTNDPSYGIKVDYVDPLRFIHSYTEDPGMNDLKYAASLLDLTIGDLKRLAGSEISDDEYQKMAQKVSGKYGNDSSKLNQSHYDDRLQKTIYGYDQYKIQVLDFEFISVDKMHFEDKESKHGNRGFYYKGSSYTPPKESVFERKSSCLHVECVYGGMYVVDSQTVFNYGKKNNIPKNIHDLTRATLSFSAVATNIQNMAPKSMVNSCIGFADMLQLTHLKIQQAIAKAKPDGLIIDIEGLENVQLGKGGELQPLDLHDIYEQTGVFYYRSKNPEGGFQGAPIQQIPNSIRNINELIGIYNHYLQLIRDATGINEAMDSSSPKGDALVGVQEQAIAAGNNAIYDVTNASMIIYKKVCQDVVKCLQIISPESVLYKAYENAIGSENMKALASFSDLPMFNFGVTVMKDMDVSEKQYLEQNIQMSIQQQEITLEDAIAIRNLKDVNQAERLLVVRRKKRRREMEEQAKMNSEMQAQQAQQAAQLAAQSRQQELQVQSQLDIQKMQAQFQIDQQLNAMRHEFQKEIELIKAQATLGFKTEDEEFKEKLEVFKEDRKDSRVKKQAAEQSKLMSQRKGQRGELQEPLR